MSCESAGGVDEPAAEQSKDEQEPQEALPPF
jgi:hypothetical protein